MKIKNNKENKDLSIINKKVKKSQKKDVVKDQNGKEKKSKKLLKQNNIELKNGKEKKSKKLLKQNKIESQNESDQKSKKEQKQQISQQQNDKEKKSKKQQKQNNTQQQNDFEEEIDENISEDKSVEIQNEKLIMFKDFKTTYVQESIYTGNQIAFSQDEKYMLSLCNYTVTIYDLDEQKIVKKIQHDEEEIIAFAINRKSQLIVTFTRNYLMRLIQFSDFKIIQQKKLDDFFCTQIVFDPSSKFIALGSNLGVIKILDLKLQMTHEFKGKGGAVLNLDFHPDYQRLELYVGSEDCSVRIYDLIINKLIKTIQTQGYITGFSFNEKQNNLAISSLDQTIKIVDLDQKKIIEDQDQNFEVNSIVYVKDQQGEKIIFTVDDMPKQFFNGEIKNLQNMQQGHQIFKTFVLKKKQLLVFVSVEQNISFYNFSHGLNNAYNQYNISGYNDEIIDLKFAKKHPELIIIATNSSVTKIFNQKTLKYQFLNNHTETVMSVDMIDDYLITGSKDKSINLYKLNDLNTLSFQLIAKYTGHQEVISSLALSPCTQNYFVSVSSDKSLKLWKTYKKQDFVQIQNSERTMQAHDKDINIVRYSPNEKLLATGSQDKTIKIWDASKLETIQILKGHKRGVWDLNFSQFQKILVSAGGDANIKIWNLSDGECLYTLQGHVNSVLKVNFICNGLEVVSAGCDGTVKLWNYKKNLCINTFEKHQGKIWAMDVQNDQICTGDNDSLFVIWQDNTKEIQNEQLKVQHETIQEIQKFNNLYRDQNLVEAAKLAFLNNMLRGFIIAVKEIIKKNEFQDEIVYSDDNQIQKQNDQNIEQSFKEIITFMVETDFNRMLTVLRDLNSSYQNFKIAQRLLNVLMKSQDIKSIIKNSKNFKNSKQKENFKLWDESEKLTDFDKLLEIIQSYSQKHFQRQEQLIKNSYYLDFFLKKLNIMSEQ